MLGLNRTHHMIHVLSDTESREMGEWTRALRAKYRNSGTFTKLDWDRLLGDCQGVIDYPSALFAADLAQLYPDAKVVMLNRDPERWYESVSETVAAFQSPGLARRARMLYCYLFAPRMRDVAAFWTEIHHAEGGYDHFREKEKAIAYMRQSYDECRAVVEEARRIEWTVQDGWEPLCEHLGVEVPRVRDESTGEMVTAPFPRINDRAMFRQNVEKGAQDMTARANEAVFGVLGRSVVLGAAGYVAYVAWRIAAARR